MPDVPIHAQFHIVHFTVPDRYVGIAWEYSRACLLATHDHASYTLARAELETMASERNVVLRWFNGEYECADNYTMQPKVTP